MLADPRSPARDPWRTVRVRQGFSRAAEPRSDLERADLMVDDVADLIAVDWDELGAGSAGQA
jgi:hypothetical protein